MAEISRDKLYAQLFMSVVGPVKERESFAQSEGQYVAACKTVADCEERMENERARSKAAEMIIEVWRSEQANARTAERVR